ncbi:hypothetical protein, partial [Pseudonocardia dioxanivorans]|uniref:hypothetical protein n=1 Tax=Pseudonocardia dioxanivorans TaxID=240495 RepID=UPI00131A50CB
MRGRRRGAIFGVSALLALVALTVPATAAAAPGPGQAPAVCRDEPQLRQLGEGRVAQRGPQE